MRHLALVGIALVAFAAWAGSRAKENQGQVPSTPTDGVGISQASACRFSARVDDGGTLNGGKLVLFYGEPLPDGGMRWVRSPSSLDCTLEAGKAIDGGNVSAQVCSDMAVGAQFGRVAPVASALVNASAAQITATVRAECWGPQIP